MPKENSDSFASFLSCLSMLETEVFLLYKQLSEKVELPLAKSLLFSIASDSEKHAALLKGIVESIAPKTKVTPKDCEEKIGETVHLTTTLSREITRMGKIGERQLPLMMDKLTELESVAGEEYSVFVQLKTLEIMSEEINRLYNVNIDSLKGIFTHIISDEEHHREIIATIKELCINRNQEHLKTDPLIEYREILKQ